MAEDYEPSALDDDARIRKQSEARQKLLDAKRVSLVPQEAPSPTSKVPTRDLGAVAKRSAISYIEEEDSDFELPCDELPGVAEHHVREAFNEIDFDDNGFVGLAELRYLLTVIGERPSDEELEEMVRMIDKEGKGQVTFEEFRSLFHPDSEVLAEMADMRPPSASSESSVSSESLSDDEGIPKKNADLLVLAGAGFLHRVKKREHQLAVDKNMPKVRQKAEGQLRARPKAGSFASSKGAATISTSETASAARKTTTAKQRGSVFHHNPSMF